MNKNNLLKRIFDFFKKFDPDELCNIVRFGLPKRRAEFIQIRENDFKDLPAPVFFLSTGRCGTNWFASLLKKTEDTMVFHEPKPNFDIQGMKIYNYLKTNDFELEFQILDLFKEIFLVGRERYLRYSVKTGKTYIETNNQLTFFAPVIKSLFRNAKFIHVIRHPGDFVRSALRREFYSKNNIKDLKRIKPLNLENTKWQAMNQIEKNSWLWNETNLFIEEFKKGVNKNKIMTFDFSNLNQNNVNLLISFLELKINQKSIKKIMNKKINRQKTGKISYYKNWKDKEKKALRNITQELASKYGYKLL